jgi:TonB family protein
LIINLNLNSITLFTEEKSSFLLAGFIHLLLFLLFFKINNNYDQAPTLSFNVVVTDVKMISSQKTANVIAKTKKKPKKKPKQKIKDKGSIKEKIDENLESVQQNVAISNDSKAIFDAAYLNNKSPAYPSMSRSLKEEGLVLIEVDIDNLGKVENIKIHQSSGFERLDNAALKAVKNWQFVAAKKNNQFIASKVQVPINFILE